MAGKKMNMKARTRGIMHIKIRQGNKSFVVPLNQVTLEGDESNSFRHDSGIEENRYWLKTSSGAYSISREEYLRVEGIISEINAAEMLPYEEHKKQLAEDGTVLVIDNPFFSPDQNATMGLDV